jgi:hypothetical protein
MISKWEHVKPKAIEMRRNGHSMKAIKNLLGIPLSTLSGWLKEIELTEAQKERLNLNWREALSKARIEAIKWHNAGKASRLAIAAEQAEKTLIQNSPKDNANLELALAFLYLGEGAKNGHTTLGSSNPEIARFFVNALRRLYQVPNEKFKCYLHLRADQDENVLKSYWANVLSLSISNFGKSSYDKRTVGKPTHEDYMGVCAVDCGMVEIQRKLMYIATRYSAQLADISKTEGG